MEDKAESRKGVGMCQLMLASGNTPQLLRMIIADLAKRDSATYNKHGAGFFTPGGGIHRQIEVPSIDHKWGCTLGQKAGSDQFILAHVRQASDIKKIGVEFNHPIETTDLILLHNGTLHPKKGELQENEIDSQRFAEDLQAIYASGKTLVESLKEAMGKYDGKFAFLIFSKKENKVYVVRGRTALLHQATLTIGEEKILIVNTEYAELKICVDIFSTLFSTMYQVVVESSPVTPVPIESIYTLEYIDKVPTLVKQDTIIETTYVAPVVSTYKPSYVTGGRPQTLYYDIEHMMLQLCLDISSLDRLFASIYNRGIITANIPELEKFLGFLTYLHDTYLTEKKVEYWYEILGYRPVLWDVGAYNSLAGVGMSFPFFLLDEARLKDILDSEEKKARNKYANK